MLERIRQEVGDPAGPTDWEELSVLSWERGKEGLESAGSNESTRLLFPSEGTKKTSNDLRCSWLITNTKLGHKNKYSLQTTQPPEITFYMLF